ncbi:MAG: hypothetical protein ABFD77_01185 [Thermotogota bacterium]
MTLEEAMAENGKLEEELRKLILKIARLERDLAFAEGRGDLNRLAPRRSVPCESRAAGC